MTTRRWRFSPCFVAIICATSSFGRLAAAVNSWGIAGPDGGPVVNLVIDPSDSNLLYVSSDAGVFKSTDRGLHWTLKASAVGSPPRVLGAGPSGEVLVGFQGNIYISRDGGETWPILGPAATNGQGEGINALCAFIDSTDPARYVVGTVGGAYITADAGLTWKGIPGAGVVYNVRQDSFNPARYYVSNSEGGLLRSEDKGATWRTSSPPVDWPGAFEFAFGPRPDLLVVRFRKAVGTGYQTSLFKSTDAGLTWADLGADGIPLFVDQNTILAAKDKQGVYRSTDAGKTWGKTNSGLTDLDVTAFVPDPTRPQRAYLGTYADGVFLTDDGGLTWTFSSAGFRATNTDTVAVHPADSNLVMMTGQRGIWRSTDGATTWNRSYSGATNGLVDRVTAILPFVGAGGRMLALNGSIFLRSDDLGLTWYWLVDVYNTNGMANDPRHAEVVFVGSQGLRRSGDGGATWSAPTPTPIALALFGVAPGAQVIYASNTSLLYKSSDGGATWSKVTSVPYLTQGLFQILVDPVTPSTVYVATGMGLFKSADEGASFTQIGGSMGSRVVQAIALDPQDPSILYAGARGAGIFKSRDGGSTWSNITADLENLEVHSIAVAPSDSRTLYVGTLGGVSRLDQVPPRVTGVSPLSGSSLGGTRIAVTGENFMPGASVLVGGKTATTIVVKDPTTIEASVPPNAAGSLDIVIMNPTYDSATAPQRFAYLPACTVVGQPSVSAPITAQPYQPGLQASVVAAPGASIVWVVDGGWITSGQGTREITFQAGASGFVVLQASEARDGDCRTSPATAVVAISDPSAPGFSAVRVIPIVLDAPGAFGSRWTTEVTITNNGARPALVQLVYEPAAALGNAGGGVASLSLAKGEQRVLPDVLAYLRDRGVAVQDGAAGGTLTALFSGLSTAEAGYAAARTTSPSGPGRAGLAYQGTRPTTPTGTTLWLFGLRETAADRTNLALVNTGRGAAVTLRVTLFSGAGGNTATLPDVVLAAGQWAQLNRVLAGPSTAQGYAKVERVSGVDDFYAYAVFNDNVTNDGSFVAGEQPAVAGSSILPVLVETTGFDSELILANPGPAPITATLRYTESLSPAAGAGGTIKVSLGAHEQRIIPAAIDFIRSGGAILPPRGASLAGTLTVDFDASGQPAPGHAGARIAAPNAGGGGYGLFFGASAVSDAAATEAWIYGLTQSGATRSNLAVANASTTAPTTLAVDVYDGSTGARVGTLPNVTLAPLGWTQFNSVLAGFGVAQGYARVRSVSGAAPFFAYGVTNDNGTNDGSFIPMAGRP